MKLAAALLAVLTGCAQILGIDDREPSACDNAERDGFETDVDCGGPDCPACADGDTCMEGSDCQSGTCVDDQCVCPTDPCGPLITPVAPCDDEFMYPGRQDRFTAGANTTCTGTVAFASVSDGVSATLCWARPDGELVCDGELAGSVYDPATPAGVSDVVQIVAAGDALCALSADGTAWCVGSANTWGELGTGDTEPVPAFARWGATSPELGAIEALAAGGPICALTRDGELFCAGYRMGQFTDSTAVPNRIASDVAAFYFAPRSNQIIYRTTSGDAFAHTPETDANLPAAFELCRQGQWPGEYSVTEPNIVDRFGMGPEPEAKWCELGDTGLVQCSGASFGQTRVLAIAGSYDPFDGEVFGVRPDGAIERALEIERAPAGTVRVPTCEP